MVYESGFTTRRTYTSRPVITSYAVSYPTVTRVSRVYKTSYPIYSTKSYTRGTRVISSPVRIVNSPSRMITCLIRSPSPVRVTRTTKTHVISSSERIPSYIYATPTTFSSSYNPSPYYTAYTQHAYTPRYITSYIPSTYVYSSPSFLYPSPVTRIYSRSLTPARAISSSTSVTPSYLKRTLPGYGTRTLTNYISTEPFTTFREETDRIRNRTHSLIRDLHTPVIRRARSMTPFPVTGYEPSSDVALDAYISRITNPVRHIAKEVRRMSMYPEPAHKYVDPELDPYRPTRKFSAPRPLEDLADDETREKQLLRYERLMTVNETELDMVKLEKKTAQAADGAKSSEQKPMVEGVKRKEEEADKVISERNSSRQAEEAGEENKKQEEELKQLSEIEKQVLEEETEKKFLEEEEKREAVEEEKICLDEEDKLAEEEELGERSTKDNEDRIAEEARLRKEAKIAKEAATKAADVATLAEEQYVREAEINRLAEIEKQAEEDREVELARQAAELAEIARQEAENIFENQDNIRETEDAEIEATRTDESVMQEPEFQVETQQVQLSIDLRKSTGGTDTVNTTTEEDSERE